MQSPAINEEIDRETALGRKRKSVHPTFFVSYIGREQRVEGEILTRP